jgi:hypothetical protein
MRAALPFLLLALVTSAAGASDKAKGPAEKRICREGGQQLGSHVRRPAVCRTAAEWEAQDRAAQALPLPLKAPQPESWERTRPQ